MLLRAPPHLHYPITITGLLFKPKEYVHKNAAIFSYTYQGSTKEYDSQGEATDVKRSYPNRYESQNEGDIVSWKITKGTIVERAGTELVEINEPCQHNVQYGGMCVDCGKDMTQVDYGTTVPDHVRANISVAHGDQALRVTRDEAQRNETAAKRRLLESKKLSLVVDLDQTIIHATVDPTVGEWMADVDNPNYDAVKDVQKFQLDEEGPGHNPYYYVKMRPGLLDFLDKISRLYELHIYTMGTRAYARNIAKIVDPDKKIFADRILSRDENGSLTAKSLQRLFPVDARMVVIIDDRGDVWDWSKSLIKVMPYDFFKGIGDINSSFLPKRQDILASDDDVPTLDQATSSDGGRESPVADSLSATSNGAESPDDSDSNSTSGTSTIDKLVSMGGANDASAMQERATQQDEQLAEQIASRPLLQQQLELEKDEKDSETTAQGDAESPKENGEEHEIPKARHNLLQDDDRELDNLEKALRAVHQTFYKAYRNAVKGTISGGRVNELKGEKSPKKRPNPENMELVPDVQEVMPAMKADVLRDCRIVFSGVIPISPRPEMHDIWRWAASFGASIDTAISKATTHVIGTKDRCTGKMRMAARDPRIKIVSLDWLNQACREWQKPDEAPYIIPVEPSKKRKRDSAESDESGHSDDDWLSPFPPWDDKVGEDNADTGDGDVSPIDDVEEDEWAKMAKEFDEDDSEESGSDTSSQSQTEDGKKRVRQDRESDTESQSGEGRRKKRRPLERTSSLNQVTIPDTKESPVAEEEESDDGFANELELALAASDDDDEHG